jgi:pyruvate ferredoxin oxidoreductase delta subunit
MDKKLKGWRELEIGAIITDAGSMTSEKTGSWRAHRPIIDNKKCIKCGLCWAYCPDFSIEITDQGEYVVNLDFCKGCGICAKECPVKAITMKEEHE